MLPNLPLNVKVDPPLLQRADDILEVLALIALAVMALGAAIVFHGLVTA